MSDRGTFSSFSRSGKFPSKPAASMTLTAVAFQDHWVRTVFAGINNNAGPQKVGLGPAARAKIKKDVKAVVDTGRNKCVKAPKKQEEKEYVLDAKPPPLSLAQKFGLVEAPPRHLSENDWSNVKAKSNARDDSKEPCVICKEDFGLQEQVILSCSHVFHRACLQAFERYTGRKTCPMCRQEQYQTRIIHEGAKLHRIKCATLIQSAWRGYVVRCWYKKLRETVPPKDPRLRKKFYIDKLKDITDRMVKSCDFDVNRFLNDIDSSLQQSRNIFKNFDALHRHISEEEWDVIQLKAVERSNQDCPICLTNLNISSQAAKPHEKSTPHDSGEDTDEATPAKPLSAVTANHKYSSQKGILKKQPTNKIVKLPAIENSAKSGCVNRVDTIVEKHRKRTTKKDVKPRQTVLLSCTHVFHETCLLTLEELAMGDIKNVCPVCRAIYQKRVISL